MTEPIIVRVGFESGRSKSFRPFDEAVGRISQTAVRTITVSKRRSKRAVDFGSYRILFMNEILRLLDSLFFRLTRNRPGLLNVNSILFENRSPCPVHNVRVDTLDQAVGEIRKIQRMGTAIDGDRALLLLIFDKDLVSPLASNFPDQYLVHLESDTPLETQPFEFIHHVIGGVPRITCQMTFYIDNAAVFRQNYIYPTRRTGMATSLSYSVDSASLLIKRYRYLQNQIPEGLNGGIFSSRIPRGSSAISIWRLTQKFFALTVQARLYSIPRLRVLLPSKKVWSIALSRAAKKRTSLYDFSQMPNPESSWLADPFLVERGSETFLFVEEFDLTKGRGEISVAQIHEGSPLKTSVCLAEDFHLSFPFIFRYSGEFYMCPETHNAKEIRIYKSEEFPLRWSLTAKHLSGHDCSDTVIFKFNRLWWLITTEESVSGGDFYSELFVYFAEDPVSGPWTEHPKNPVVVDSGRGRNGGFHICDDRLIRFGQEFGDFEYGVGFHPYEITQLTEFDYREESAQCEHFDALPPQLSSHHMDISSNYIVMDTKK